MIEKSDLERVWREMAVVFHGDDPIDKWVAKNEIDVGGLIDFLDETLPTMVMAAFKIDQEKSDSNPETVMLALGATVFFMGWEMHSQLGKESSHIPDSWG